MDLWTKILFSADRAMTGAVSQELRAVTIAYNKSLLTLKAYFDKGATENDKELINCVLTEMAADLWQDIEQFQYEPIDLPFPKKMEMLKEWIYKRHENLEE